MSSNSKIAWTDATWNPVTGCTKYSLGCQHCYAESLTRRLQAMGQAKYAGGFDEVVCHPQELALPLSWRKPRRIFVNSMSDTFHPDVPDTFIHQLFAVMGQTPWHEYQVLTKRADRLAAMAGSLPWRPNIWMGVTVEHADYVSRIAQLQATDAAHKFLSLEPLLGPLPNLDLTGIGWVIVAGESGSGARPLRADWVRDLRDQCLTAQIPFFFKQWSGFRPKTQDALLDGRLWHDMPTTSPNLFTTTKELTLE